VRPQRDSIAVGGHDVRAQRVSGLKSGVIYTLRADIVTTNGDTVALWSHVECKAPA